MRTSEIVLRYPIAQRGEAVMLLKPRITCQVPYGAFDQKIHYQYNLLRALLLTFALVGAILGALFIGANPTSANGGKPFEGCVLDSVIVSVDFSHNTGGTRTATGPKVSIDVGAINGIPVPVAVDDLQGSSGNFEATFGVALGNLPFTGIIGSGSNGLRARSGRGGLGYPDASKFIPHEIAPQGLEWAIPEYPRLAKAAGLEGVVWIAAFVDERGKVQAVQIAKASGSNAGFERAAEAAAWKCTFSPAVQNGNPVAIWVTFSFRFRLSQD